jgi:spore germination cell wall hydrolase CwlJ-like protein
MKNLIITLILCFVLFSPTALHKQQPTVHKHSTKELNKQILCLTSALHAEARGEPPEGIRAVATVIYNRTKHKNYPSDFCGVIKQPYQFSYLNGGKPIVKPTYKPSEHKVKATIDQLAFEAAVGRLNTSLSPEFLFYHTTKLKKLPKWSKKAKISVIIGRHKFIKE